MDEPVVEYMVMGKFGGIWRIVGEFYDRGAALKLMARLVDGSTPLKLWKRVKTRERYV